ncbi:MAG TPA: nickel pincer cofactor biosynthesis protein LarC, partial [Bacteroidales bacterium]|nr:nickel pincer cofactor biosynthesis protein LarC [Bacteroidales bacterium]
MKILYYDCFSGISGDMNLGAMIDLGVPAEILISGLNSLNLEGWKLEITKEQRHGIFGTMVTVRTGETEDHHDHGLDHHHDHPHDHDSDHHHDHHHGSPEKLDHIAHDMYLHGNKDEIHHHPHRNLKDIEEIINGSGLNANVREIALKIFRKIGEAEATVHNKSLYEIHFHEVGAIDSIIDIVGAAISFDYLRPEKIYFSDIELGGGTVKCAHGILPVPAPATSLILKGLPVHHGGVNFEATTPTGAAILATIGERIPSDLRYSVASTGYGIGHKENPSLPNMVRVYLAETDDKNATAHNAILVECNVDDMNPELVDYITGRLLGCGIPDVCFIPVVMKKTRPAFIIRVICEESHLPMVREILFTESTTLGLRVIP